MGLEWQNPNTEILKPVEKTEQVEAVQNLEQELTPEQIEQIMAKVQDINQKGVAYSLIRPDKFENVINDGLLGSYESPMEVMSTEIEKSEWAAKTKKDRNSNVFFNITGRQELWGKRNADDKIRNSRWVSLNYLSQDKVVVLFDLSKFKEEPPIFYRTQKGKFKTGTYRAIDHWDLVEPDGVTSEEIRNIKYDSDEYRELLGKIYEKNRFRIKHFGDTKNEGESTALDMDGFAISHRVAPRLFQGIMVKFTPDDIWERKDEEGGGHLDVAYQFKNPIFQERVKPYLEVMLKTNNLVPIYDPGGNLFWPKQMSYEEVKKFVEERNTNKEEK